MCSLCLAARASRGGQCKPLCVSESLRRKYSRIRPFNRFGNRGQRVGVDEVNKGRLLRDNFLHSIKTLFAFLQISRRRLHSHQAINLRLPRGFWRLLLRVPRMIFRRTQPDVHLSVGVEIDIAKAEHRSLVIKFLRYAFDQRREVKRNHVDFYPELSKIFLNHHGYAFSRLAAGIRDDGKLNRIAALVEERSALQMKSNCLQALHRGIRAMRLSLQLTVKPKFIGSGNGTNGGLSVTAKDNAA